MTPSNSSPKECILAVDDERGFLGMVKEVLECLGFTVHTASSPKEALKLYEEHCRDIGMVLLDYRLPGMSGEMVFEELQRLNPDVRVVLLTGCQESVADKMLTKGLRGYLQKPFGIRELGQKIRSAIDAPAIPLSASVSPPEICLLQADRIEANQMTNLVQTDISGNEPQTASVAQKGNCRQKECILVIDDDERFLDMLKAALECFDFIVHTASSPKEAITLYRDHQRDISMVLLDYRLPGSSGELVFENLQCLNPDVRVVLLTGLQESVADKMLAKGLRGYLQKPFSLLDLAQKIRNAINSPVWANSASPSPA
jgi:CheY-like chemotaxis protein